MKPLIMLIVMASFFSACSISRKEALEQSIKTYSRALQVKDEFILVGFVEPEVRPKFVSELGRLDPYEFSLVEVRSVFPGANLESAVVTMDLEFYSKNDGGVHQMMRILNWKYKEDRKVWVLSEISPVGTSTSR